MLTLRHLLRCCPNLCMLYVGQFRQKHTKLTSKNYAVFTYNSFSVSQQDTALTVFPKQFTAADTFAPVIDSVGRFKAHILGANPPTFSCSLDIRTRSYLVNSHAGKSMNI